MILERRAPKQNSELTKRTRFCPHPASVISPEREREWAVAMIVSRHLDRCSNAGHNGRDVHCNHALAGLRHHTFFFGLMRTGVPLYFRAAGRQGRYVHERAGQLGRETTMSRVTLCTGYWCLKILYRVQQRRNIIRIRVSQLAS